MTCIKCFKKDTRYGEKMYLAWRDPETGKVIYQFYNWYDPPRRGSAAFEDYLVAFNLRSEEVTTIDFNRLVGCQAEVLVETVRPIHQRGPLKGQPKRANLHYSKVAQILGSAVRVRLKNKKGKKADHD